MNSGYERANLAKLYPADFNFFISFIKRATTPIEFFRGDLLNLSESIEKKGDELRPTTSQVSKMNGTDL